MQFSKASILTIVKEQIPTELRVRTAYIDNCLTLAMNEYSLHLISVGTLKTYDESISKGDQSFTADGGTDADLLDIWAIKLTDANGDYSLCEYLDKDVFLREWEARNDVAAGTPTCWTMFETDAGFPVVRFNCATDGAYTATVYYHAEITPDTVQYERFAAPLISLTLAWFNGKQTMAGRNWYEDYKQMMPSARSRDKMAKTRSIKMTKSKFDQNVDTVRAGIRQRRS